MQHVLIERVERLLAPETLVGLTGEKVVAVREVPLDERASSKG